MLERIIEFIGRLLSSLFGRAGDIITDTRVETKLIREQANNVKVHAKSTINISISEESHVNYFRNRVVGEFLKVLATLVPYQYEQKSDKWVAYFVRRKTRSITEYIKFSKNLQQDTDADISYTYINKMLSGTGITTNIGNSSKSVLLVDDAVSLCVYAAISGKKAPLYLCHYIPNKSVDIGNPTFIIDCWVLMVKAIAMDVDKYFNNNSDKEGKLIENLMTQAGMHLFMSYFKSLKNPFYRSYYRTSSIDSIVKAVKLYNAGHFNVNKITNIRFADGKQNSPVVSQSEDGRDSIISAYGLNVTFTGKISEVGEAAFKRFNYKLAESLVKATDANLRRNFIFYMLSTGGVGDTEILKMYAEEYFEKFKYQDVEMSEYNNKVEPVVDAVMSKSSFIEDEAGDLASVDFSTFIEQSVKASMSSDKASVPKELPALISAPVDNAANTANIASAVNVSVQDTQNTRPDVISSLQQSSNDSGKQELKPQHDIKLVSAFTKKPLAMWTYEECMEVLGGGYEFDTNISRSDVLERMFFIREKSKEV